MIGFDWTWLMIADGDGNPYEALRFLADGQYMRPRVTTDVSGNQIRDWVLGGWWNWEIGQVWHKDSENKHWRTFQNDDANNQCEAAARTHVAKILEKP